MTRRFPMASRASLTLSLDNDSGSNPPTHVDLGSSEYAPANPQVFKYDFALEYRLIEEHQLSIAEETSRRERLVQQGIELKQAKVLERMEEISRKQAAEESKRLLKEKEEIERVEREEKLRLEKQEKELMERLREEEKMSALSPQQRDMVVECEFVLGIADFDTRKEFLAKFDWDFARACAVFFEYNGVLSDIPPPVKEPALPDCRLTIVFPDFSKHVECFKNDQSLWEVYQFIGTHSYKWSSRPYMIGNSERLFKEDELNYTVVQAGLTPSGTVFVKKF